MDKYRGASIGIVIECEGGYVTVPSYTSATAYDKNGTETQKWSGAEDHFENFIKAVRSRKIEDLHVDILEGHLSSALCHNANISYRLGKRVPSGQIRDALRADAGLAEAFGRMEEHLAANGVDLNTEQAALGMPLRMNPKTERFKGNRKANELLTRKYRVPFVASNNV